MLLDLPDDEFLLPMQHQGIEIQHDLHLDLIAVHHGGGELFQIRVQMVDAVLIDPHRLDHMGERDQRLHGIKRHGIIADDIQDFYRHHALGQDSVLHDLGLIHLDGSLTVADLQDLPLHLTDLEPLPDPAFGKILHQQTVKRLQATFGHTFFERCVHVHEKGMLLLTVDLDIQFQHRIHLDDPLLPVRIWLHIQTLVDHTDLHIGDHLHPAALALHLLIKWQGVLQPLQRISLLIPPVEQKDKQFAFDQDLIFLRTDIHPPHLHRAPEHLGDVWFIGGQGDLLLHPYRILFMYAQPQDFHRLLFHGDLLRAQSGRQRQLHQFIHNGKK